MKINLKFLLIGTSLSLIPNLTYAQCTTAQTCASLGYTQTSCPNGGIKCPFGDGWYCRPEASSPEPEEPKATLGTYTGYAANCNIGDILNNDGTCTTEKENNKTPIGVVIAIKNNCGWAMTAQSIGGYAWSTNFEQTDTGSANWKTAITNFNACNNTQKLTKLGNDRTYQAAWAAVNYTPHVAPETKGKWCLPAPGMLNSLYINLNVINNTISKLNGDKLIENNEYIWSSSEGDSSYYATDAWHFNTNDYVGAIQGGLGHSHKDSNLKDYRFSVRPVIEF